MKSLCFDEYGHLHSVTIAQPVYIAEDNTDRARFKPNTLVRFLLDAGGIDINKLSMLPNIPQEEWEQFYQLIGYSIDGYDELSRVSDKSKREARTLAAAAKIQHEQDNCSHPNSRMDGWEGGRFEMCPDCGWTN
jgi:hypothetical protein